METWGNSCFLSVKQLPQELAIFHTWILDIFVVSRDRNCFLCVVQGAFTRTRSVEVLITELLYVRSHAARRSGRLTSWHLISEEVFTGQHGDMHDTAWMIL